ncbi:hypothetical protein BDW74DRAFT_143360 [Aspergillus multicolor]|uniref:uncharacterized protein n=1 Tax=Aspergillus multicolor TaxID=41759 RepID=UPI003CCCBDF8
MELIKCCLGRRKGEKVLPTFPVINKRPAVHETSLYGESCSSSTRHKRFLSANKNQPTFVLEPQFTTLRSPADILLPDLAGPALSSSLASPLCKRCGSPTILKNARMWNQNGNSGRPFYSCGKCGKFRSWADGKGISDQNPRCLCDKPSRWGQSSREKQRRGFFNCATGDCTFFVEALVEVPVPSMPELQDGA